MKKDSMASNVIPIATPELLNLAIEVMKMDNEVDVEALTEPFDEDVYVTREQYGKNLSYVPAQEYRKRLNSVLGSKWSFIVVSEQKVTDPVQKYDKEEDEYTDGTMYLKVIGALIIPGLGVQMGYGVKPTYGSTEANDWKAAATDAFKKACSMFGLEVEYDNDDSIPSHGKGSGSGSSGKAGEKLSDDELKEAIEELEYDNDELEEANELEVTFGKYANLTLEEIVEEDVKYLKWLAGNANDEDMRNASQIVLADYIAENPKEVKKIFDAKGKGKDSKGSSKDKDNKGSSKGKSSSSSKSSKGKGKSKDEDDDEEDDEPKSKSKGKDSKSSSKEKGSKGKSSSSSKGKSKDDDEEDSDEIEEMIETIQEIFDEEDYDDVTIDGLIRSVSTSKKFPKGKKKLEELTLKELNKLADVLVDDEDDED